MNSKQQRPVLAAAMLSAAALALGVTNAQAGWEYVTGSNGSGVQPPPAGGQQLEAYATCNVPFPSVAAGTYKAKTGLHRLSSANHAWVQNNSSNWDNLYFQYGDSLGYCPEAQLTLRCGTSSNWNTGVSQVPAWTPLYPYTPGGFVSPNFTCSSSRPWMLETKCKARVTVYVP